MNKIKNDSSNQESLKQSNRLLRKEIAALKKELQEIRDSAKWFNQLFEMSPEAHYLNDLKGKILEGNQAAVDLLGYKKEELIGKSLFRVKILPKDQIAKATAALSRNILGKSTGPEEYVIQRKNGEKVTVEVLTQPVKRAGKRIVLGTIRNISARKKIELELQNHQSRLERIVEERTSELMLTNAELKKEIADRMANESALRESEQKFRSFIETSADIVFQVSSTGIIEFVSPQVKEMYGYNVDELVGKPISSTTPIEDIPSAMSAIGKVFTGKPLKNFEVKQQDRHGNTLLMEINAVPIRKNNRVIGMRGIMRDITRRKQAELVLRESEERYRDLVEKANIGILIDAADGQILYFNKKIAEFFGYSMEEMKHQSVESLVYEEDFEKVIGYHRDRVAGRRTKSLYEFRGKKKDGTILYLEVHAATVKDGANITGTRSYMWDITSRKLAEQARIKSEHRYRTLFNNMRDGSVVVALDGTILDFNQAFLKIVGFSAGQLTGKNWFDLSPDEWRAVEKKIINQEVLKNKYSRIYEKELIRKTGEKIPVELRTYLIPDDSEDKSLFWVMIRDVSERKKIEREVNMLAQTVRSVRECVCVTDMQENILFVNDAFVRTYGFERDELLGKNISVVRPDNFTRALDTPNPVGGWEGELINKRKDGTEFPVFVSVSDIRDEKNNRVAMVGVATDISDRKKFEEQFRQVQKMEAVGQLAGGIAHDFNNILTAINGYAELSLMKMEAKNPLFKEITGILKAGKRASGLVRQLLAFSRKQVIELEILEVNRLILDLDKMLRRLIGEDIDVQMNLAKDLGNIKADPGQIEQILVNIVVNARDAINQRTSAASEKKITIDTNNIILNEKYIRTHPGSKEGPHVCIAISDTGIGMSSEIKNKVFEPFFTTKDKTKGTGLGLATVYGIVKQNNGYIDVYSEEGNGTTVRVYWPLESATPVAKSEPDHKPDIDGGTETLLFVEDNIEVRKFSITALETLGYKVYSAANGIEAIRMIEKDHRHFDLIITDVIMPGMGGDELAEKIHSVAPQIKMLFTSGYTDTHITHTKPLSKGRNFLQKPYSIESLASKVREVLTA